MFSISGLPIYLIKTFFISTLPSYDKSHERQQFASALLAEINKIYEAIPNLTPKETAWLETELASDNQNRRLKAIGSDEYILKDLKKSVDNMKGALTAIHEKKTTDLKQEMLLWIIIADGFMHSGTAFNLSELAGKRVVIDSKHKYNDHFVLCYSGDVIARTILIHIIAPYLAEYQSEIYLKQFD